MNEVAELTVQYVNPPKEGKKWGSIKSSEGDSFFGPPNLLKEFTVGEVAKIEWKPFGENAKSIVKKLYNGEAKPKPAVRASTSKSDSAQIYVTAHSKYAVGAFIENGRLDEAGFVELGKALLRCHVSIFSQRADDLDDNIPY